MSNPVAASWQKLSGRTRTITAIVVFGLIGGGGAVAFHLAMHAIYAHGLQALAARSTVVFLLGSLGVILAGSAITGWLLTRFCPEAAGSGIPQVKLAFWRDAGAISWRVTWVKFVAGVLSVGCGNSLGREGPSVQLAAGLAANSAHLLGIPRHKRRSAAAAGGAAGLAAAFNTPIAAVTFVLEEIIGDLNSRLLGPILLASILGALVAHGILGAQPAFTLHDPGAPGWRGYVLTPFIAAGAALVGCLFQKLALGLRARQRRLQKLPPGCVPRWGAWRSG